MGGLKEAKKITGVIKDEDFIFEPHKQIFKVIIQAVEKSEEFNAVTLINRLKSEPTQNSVRFTDLIQEIVSEWYIGPSFQSQYISTLYERRTKRKLGEIIGEFLQDTESADLAEFFSEIDNIKSGIRQTGSYTKFSEAMQKVVVSIEKREGVEFHFSLSKLDHWVGGLGRGELLLVGGFTAQGKSSLCLQMAVDFAEQGKRVLFCSSEMSEFEMARRILGNYCEIQVLDLRRAEVDSRKLERLKEAIETLEGLEAVVCLVSNVGQVKKAILEYKPDIVFMDHLHNLQGKGRSPYEKTTGNIKELKEMALAEKVGMIVASQLHRPQDDKMRPPRISDLRESGAIEETANSIILLYWKRQRENEELLDLEEMEVRLVKNRDGRTGSFNILFEPKYCRFKNWYGEGENEKQS